MIEALNLFPLSYSLLVEDRAIEARIERRALSNDDLKSIG